MKNKFRFLICTLMCILLSAGVYAQKEGKKGSDITGKWNYEAPTAPYGYNQGKIDILNKAGKLSAKLDIQGNITAINEIKQTGNTYTCTLYIEGANVDITLQPEGAKLTGKAEVNGDVMPVTFSRIKE